MPCRNTGKPTEELFEDSISALGKRGYFHRIMDASAVHGLTGKVGHIKPAPSDYVVVVNGVTEFAEVKSTQDSGRFKFSLLKQGQNVNGTMIVAAGGLYRVYVRKLLTDQWYRVPFYAIQAVKKAGAQSLLWTEMEDFKWHLSWTT